MKKKLGRKLLVSALTASMVVSSLAGCGKKDSSKKAEQETSESKGNGDVRLTNEELEAFIINQTRILQNECTDLTVCG